MALQNLNHKHIIVTATLRSPPQTATVVESWLASLVEKVEMKILMGPYAIRCDDLGNEGVTGVVVISTSHCSAHFWDTDCEPFVKFDLYSCKDFDPLVVLDHLKVFDPVFVDAMVIDRNSLNKVSSTCTGEFNEVFEKGFTVPWTYWIGSLLGFHT